MHVSYRFSQRSSKQLTDVTARVPVMNGYAPAHSSRKS